MADILIEHGFIITMDPERRVIRDGSVYVDDGRIISVGKSEEIEAPSSPEFVIDAKNKVIMPGFINTHTHIEQYLRGVYELTGDFFKIMLPLIQYEHPMGLDFGLSTCAEMIYGGATTTCCTHSLYLDDLARAVEIAGNRAVIGMNIPEVDFAKLRDGVYEYIPHLGDEGVRAARDLYDRWQGEADGRITTILAPHAPDFTTTETFLKIKEMAEMYDLRIMTHLSQSREEVLQVRKMHGKTPPEYLEEIGLLDERLLVAHCTYASETDTLLIRDAGSKILHCRSVRNPLLQWLDLGIPVGLGTDDLYHSMLPLLRQNMRGAGYRAEVLGGYHGLIVNSGLKARPTPLRINERPSPYELLELATIRGAEVLGMDKEVGSLEPGKMADIITIDMSNPLLAPTQEPVSSIVLYGNASDIDTVMVKGRMIKEGGTITSFDAEDAMSKAQERIDGLWERFFEEYPEQKTLWRKRVAYDIQ
jgi:5-methylthioadenosine/S-adenosylhomocysteine deaminase